MSGFPRPLHKTRFSGDGVTIYVSPIDRECWQCVVYHDGRYAQTGEQCATKWECFTVALPAVASNWGFTV